MAQEINVSVPNMLKAVQLFGGAHDNIFRQVQGMEDDFNALSSTWTGDAAQQFQAAMQGFYGNCNTILRSLDGLAHAVDNAAVNYLKQHNQATDAAAALGRTVEHEPAGLPGFSS